MYLNTYLKTVPYLSWKGGEKWNDCFFFRNFDFLSAKFIIFGRSEQSSMSFLTFFLLSMVIFKCRNFSTAFTLYKFIPTPCLLMVSIHFTTYLHVVKLIKNLIIILETNNTYKHESHERRIRTKPVLLINKTTINEEIFLERNFPSKKNRWSFGANYDLDMKPIDFFTQRKCWNFCSSSFSVQFLLGLF